MNVLIAGAGGTLGLILVDLYLTRGDNVTAMVLSTAEMRGLKHKNLSIIEANVTKPETIEGMCRGQDIIISSIGITRLKGHITHEAVDYMGNLNLLKDAIKYKAGKFGFISPAGTNIGYNDVPLLNAKYKFEQELQKSTIDWIIFRSGGFFTDLAELKKAALKGPLFVIGDGTQRSTPVAVEDLAQIMVDEMSRSKNSIIEIGGPEDLSWNDTCRIIFEAVHRPVRVIKVPIWLCKLTLALLKPFTFKYYAMGSLLLFMSTNNVISPKKGRIKFAEYLKMHP